MIELTLKEAADKLKCSEKTIRRRIKGGQLKAKLVPGPKGYEYRVVMDDMPKGASKKDKVQKIKIKISSSKQEPIAKKNAEKKAEPDTNVEFETHKLADDLEQLKKSRLGSSAVDYKGLYEDLLKRHEQAMMLMGRLQSEIEKRVPVLEEKAASLQKKHDEIAKRHEETERELNSHKQHLERKEYIIKELSRELEGAAVELDRRAKIGYAFKRFFGFR